jgi:hypothetical protein
MWKRVVLVVASMIAMASCLKQDIQVAEIVDSVCFFFVFENGASKEFI